MAQKTLKYYYRKAKKERWALPQFNFSAAEQLQGIVRAAEKLRSPLLLGTSEGDAGFVGMGQAVAMVEQYRRDTGIPIFLNLDHGHSEETIKEAIDAGYDAVHFDGSRLPLRENISATRRIVRYAFKHGISAVEGEYQEIPGEHSSFHKGSLKIAAAGYTDPEEAREFCQKTGVSALAVLVGTVHGMYRRNPRLDLELLKRIRKRVQCFLVLHGGSGTPAADLLGAVRLGVVKVNVSTELRAAFTQALRTSMRRHPEEITPYNLFPPAVEAVEKTAAAKITFLGSAHKL